MFTVIAEEVLFRRVVQQHIGGFASACFKVNGPITGLIVISTLFGLAHVFGGWQIAVLATLAGLLYGYSYIKTRRIKVALFAHLVLNVGTVVFLAITLP